MPDQVGPTDVVGLESAHTTGSVSAEVAEGNGSSDDHIQVGIVNPVGDVYALDQDSMQIDVDDSELAHQPGEGSATTDLDTHQLSMAVHDDEQAGSAEALSSVEEANGVRTPEVGYLSASLASDAEKGLLIEQDTAIVATKSTGDVAKTSATRVP